VRPPVIAFGMNSLFAVRQFLPETLAMVRDRGYAPVVIAPPDRAGAPPNGLPDAEYRFVPVERDISPAADLLSLFRIWRVLRTVRPEVANMSTPKMALLGGLAGWLAGVPRRFYTLRGLRYETTRSWKRAVLVACERIACACAHRVICISRSVRDTLVRDGIAPAGKLTLLGERASEGIALPRGAAAAESAPLLRRAAGIPEDAEVIGFTGRLTRDKGIPELVEAFLLLRREGRRVRLLLLGDFEAGDPVPAAVADRIRTDPDIHWLGYVADPRPYYFLMDVFVFPTRREGLGRVLLEAAAAGKPVVSTLTTGVVDAVIDGVTGVLVPPGDAPALARATAELLSDPERAARMGRAARRLVEEQFDNAVYLERLAAVLQSFEPSPAGNRRTGSIGNPRGGRSL